MVIIMEVASLLKCGQNNEIINTAGIVPRFASTCCNKTEAGLLHCQHLHKNVFMIYIFF